MANALSELRAALKTEDRERIVTALENIDAFRASTYAVADKLLVWAVSHDHVDIVREALRKGASPNAPKTRAPYLAAATSVMMARLLVEHGADVHATWKPPRNDGKAANVLYYLSDYEDHADLKRYLVELIGLVDAERLDAIEPMPETDFWAIVEGAFRAGRDDSTRQARQVVRVLGRRTIREVVAFQRRFDERRAQLLSPELWAFYWIIDGGCSDDTFLFEVPSRVIALGRAIYEGAIANPDSLLRHAGKNRMRYVKAPGTIDCPRLSDAARVPYRLVTGRDEEEFVRLVGPLPPGRYPRETLRWDEGDDGWLARVLPNTWRASRPRAT